MVGVCHKKLGLSGLCFFVSFFAFNDFASSSATSNSDGFYLGLSYSPAFSKIRDFHVANDAAETMGVYPYLKKSVSSKLQGIPDHSALARSTLNENALSLSPLLISAEAVPVGFNNGNLLFKPENFDWDAPNPHIAFKDSFFTAVVGNVGYKVGNTRVEIEVGYEKFRTKNSTGDEKTYDSDGIFLLAKELANSVVMDQTDRLGRDLGKLKKKEMHMVSNSINLLNPAIDKMLCTLTTAKPASPSLGTCLKPSESGDSNSLSLAFGGTHATSNEVMDTYTADKLSSETASLSRADKRIVASAFSKVEGAEVLEAHSIRTTSVMLNACHDFRTIAGLTPFACAGIGGDFVEVVDFSITPKPAYQLKAGLSFNINDSISTFSSAFFHHVLGDGQFSDLRLARLSDDVSLPGKSKEFGVASFSLAYYGAEFGLRLAF